MFKRSFKPEYIVIFILAAGLLLRMLLAYAFVGYPNDVACFKSWADLLFSNGLSKFYTSPQFTDYPPGYMYMLYLLGALRQAFNIPLESQIFTMLIKMPAILCDIASGWLIYKLASTKLTPYFALLLTSLYIFNPAVIINSAVWGQVDAIYTFIVALSLYYLTKELLFKGFLLFTCAICIKPQSLFFSPVYLFYLYDVLKRNKFDKSTIRYIFVSGIVCFSVLFLLILPFTEKFNFMPVFKQYVQTLASYPYASVNAYNLFAALGANWVDVGDKLLFMSYGAWGTLFIVLIVAASFFMLYRRVGFFFTAAFINYSTFILSAKMHERYVFPALALFLISFVYKKNYLVAVLYILLSVTLYINCADVLTVAVNGNDYSLIARSLTIVSWVNIAVYVFAAAVAVKEVVSNKN